MENYYPGMWQRWFKNQCVAVGWKDSWGFKLRGKTKEGMGWKRARKALDRVANGDKIIVQLQNHRLGRVGEVTGKAVEDGNWDPLVPRSKGESDGEMGRRIFVRWDLTIGPDDRDLVVSLPEGKRLTPGELRPTICEISSQSWDELVGVMNDPGNWVGLMTHFDYEKALSGYIAAYPHRLEDGLLPHPSQKVRERVFGDMSRLDVLLIDRADRPVIVECKQHQPTVDNIKQLRHYLNQYRKELGEAARGILVHGGARKLAADVQRELGMEPVIEVVQYRLEVDFSPCN